MTKIAINICNRDRPTELALLLTSLRNQTEQDFDIFILDDKSGTPLQSYHFLNMIIAQLQNDGHRVDLERTEFNYGVSKARQTLVEKSLYSYDYILRVDDDVILEPDFIERLLSVLEEGYDIASGVTPPLTPSFVRNSDMVDIANRVIIKEGKLLMDGDDCGMLYTDEKIVPAHHFRSSALMRTEVHEKVKYWPTKLTKHGFREETMFSFKAQLEGFKIGVDLKAIAWHLNTPSGGERFADSQKLIEFNKQVLNEYVDKNHYKLAGLFPDKPEMSKLELQKENNMAR